MNDLTFDLYVDGAASGNPGPGGIGVVLYYENQLVTQLSRYIGQVTSNQAEYRALITGLEEALALGAKHLRIFSDSQLMVKQVQGLYKVRDKILADYHMRAQGLLKKLVKWDIAHIPREQNSVADSMAREATGWHSEK